MALEPQQLALVELVDGRLSVGEIAARVRPAAAPSGPQLAGPEAAALGLFERL